MVAMFEGGFNYEYLENIPLPKLEYLYNEAVRISNKRESEMNKHGK